MNAVTVIQQSSHPIQQENGWTPEQSILLKNQFFKDASDDEFKIFCYAVQRTGLDPFMKQIHAVKRWNKKANRNDMSIQVGIDGYRLIADRTGAYAGSDDALFDNEKIPTKATVTVYKMIQGQRCPFTASARWTEYAPEGDQGFMWRKMPCVMLAKVAEALALRKAFPAELSGVYTNEEMEQADHPVQESKDESRELKTIQPKVLPKALETPQISQVSQNYQNSQNADWKKKAKPSDAQLKRLFAIAMSCAWNVQELSETLMTRYGLKSSKELNIEQYEEFCQYVQANSKGPQVSQEPEAESFEDSDASL